ncbi:hypothetical protein [Melioribacter sp. OK-6-Me]|uniref:hypothetical protein n=1 Tax=Melioribacter sp. OK-6-Me TaxID=3423433 RepID=UPI003F5CC2AB
MYFIYFFGYLLILPVLLQIRYKNSIVLEILSVDQLQVETRAIIIINPFRQIITISA